MAKTKTKTARAKSPRKKKAAKGPPVICGCPANTRTRVRAGSLVCETPSGAQRSASCSIEKRTYRIGAPRTRTDERAGKSQGLVLTGPGLDYATTSEPCKSARKQCPVQLVFRNGKPNLRFCLQAGNGQPGYLVPVSSPSAARKLAAEACAEWAAAGKRFTPENSAVRASGGALGGFRRRR